MKSWQHGSIFLNLTIEQEEVILVSEFINSENIGVTNPWQVVFCYEIR